MQSVLTTMALFGGLSVSAQEYPTKLVRIVTGEAGAGSDMAARLIAQGLSTTFGQQVIVDNRAGAGGILAAQAVAQATPDGYTLLFYGNTIWLSPLLRDQVPYDPVKSFAPISLAASAPNTLVIHPSLPVKTVKDLISLAHSRPGELNYGSGSAGSAPHLAAELFKSMAKTNVVRVPYKGGGSAVSAVIAGEVQLVFASAGAATPFIRSGRLKALAVTSAERTALAPGLPTIAESGLPGYESASLYAMFAPAGTPPGLVARINQEVTRTLSRTDIRERFFSAGADIVASTPEQLGAAVRSEMTKLGKVIREAGLKSE